MKKIFSLAVACCLALTGLVFSSCEGMQSIISYQFGYDLDESNTVSDAILAQFELSPDGHIVIYNEMKKTADQSSDASRTCIWKSSSRDKAVQSAKAAFAAGMEAVRKDNASFKGIIIRLYLMDPDTNKKVEIEKATI